MRYKETEVFVRNSAAIDRASKLDTRQVNRLNAQMAQRVNHRKRRCTQEQIDIAYRIGIIRLNEVQ